jgi:hypothetical protein
MGMTFFAAFRLPSLKLRSVARSMFLRSKARESYAFPLARSLEPYFEFGARVSFAGGASGGEINAWK